MVYVEELTASGAPYTLMALLVLSVATDLRYRRISDRVTYPAMAAGLLGHYLTSGWEGVALSWLGGILGAGVLLVPFRCRALGGGDVKLMAAVGALQGPQFVLGAALGTALAGGPLAALWLWRNRCAAATRTNGALHVGPAPSGARSGLGTMPYAPAIAAGVALAALRWPSLGLLPAGPAVDAVAALLLSCVA